MTQADIDLMLQHLAVTARYLQDSGRLLKDAADHIRTVSDHLQKITAHIDHAVSAGLAHLHEHDPR